jgi:predicted DNA-binding ribbon-helix-helix protein
LVERLSGNSGRQVTAVAVPILVWCWGLCPATIRSLTRDQSTGDVAITGKAVRSAVLKRSLVIAGHKTSVSLEDEFWDGLKEIASERGTSLKELVGAIDAARNHTNLSSAIRLYVLGFYRDQSVPR